MLAQKRVKEMLNSELTCVTYCCNELWTPGDVHASQQNWMLDTEALSQWSSDGHLIGTYIDMRAQLFEVHESRQDADQV